MPPLPPPDSIPTTGAPEVPLDPAPPYSATPSAHDVKAMMRSQNIRFGLGLLAILIVTSLGAFLAGDSRAASRDSFNSTAVVLANNERNACITLRRNVQSEAMGKLTIAANNAEVAGLIDRNLEEVRRQRDLYDQAVLEWFAATQSLSDEVLNSPVDEGGCGPVIRTLADLQGVEDPP